MMINTYAYRQNNSHGRHHIPYTYVLVEAHDADTANEKAQEVGVYFDPNFRIDCEHCGPRWEANIDGDTNKARVCFGGVENWLNANAPYNPLMSVLLYEISGKITKTTFGRLAPTRCR